MSLEFVGIGDLHLDGKLRKYLPDLNSRIMSEVDKVIVYARRNGIKLVVLYGDICETPTMSKEAGILFLRHLLANTDLMYIIDLGNHDTENSETHSLQFFTELCKSGMLPHVKIVETPTTFFAKSDTPLRVLPWPSLDTRADCFNVIHEAVRGAVWDHGRPIDDAKRVKHWSAAGHIHTAQTCGKVNFSGTLYQTSFGEKPKKYFHHVQWDDADSQPEVKRIRHSPSFKLVNLVVQSEADLESIEDDPNTLYKVFVHADVALDATTFDSKPNVVKVNSFKSKTELQTLITEELRLDDEFELPSVLSVENNLKTWLSAAAVPDDLKKAAFSKYKRLFRSATTA